MSLNIVFAGTPAFGVPCLDALVQSSHHIQAIYTQPDRPAGRGRKLQASAVKEWALVHDVPVYQPLNFKDPQTVAELAALQPDVMVVIAYGLILPQAVLEIPQLGCINVHASLLPRWRGASPIQHAILHGDQESGVTIMQMDSGMDTGDILRKVRCPISSTDTSSSLHDKLALISAQPLLHTLNELANGTAHPKIQDETFVTYAGKINKEDALINWHDSAAVIDQKIRAFNPWPIAYTLLRDEVIRIHHAQIAAINVTQPPGTILQVNKKGVLIATGNQALLIEMVQLAGGKIMHVADWLNSPKAKLHTGLVF